jgi:hypothetical protein
MIAMRSWEGAAPALACLTPRDRKLLRVLADLRYLTCDQAHRTCYAGLVLPSVRTRLGELKRRGLLRRLRGEALTDRRGFWSLAPLGRAAAAALETGERGGGPGPNTATARPAAIAALQLDHIIGTNEVFCALWETRRAGRLPALRWLAGHRALADLGQTHVVPDGVVLIAGPDGWWTYYVERDRGTMPLQAIRDKLDRYALLFRIATAQQDDPAWHDRLDAWLLFACDDSRRAIRVAAAAADAGLDRVWAGLAEDCVPGLAASLDGVARVPERPPLPAWAAGVLVLEDPTPAGEEDAL